MASPSFSRRATGPRPSRSCSLGSHTLSSEWGLTGTDKLTQVSPRSAGCWVSHTNVLIAPTLSTAASDCEQKNTKDHLKPRHCHNVASCISSVNKRDGCTLLEQPLKLYHSRYQLCKGWPSQASSDPEICYRPCTRMMPFKSKSEAQD